MTEENPTLSVTLLYVSGLHTQIKGRDWENGGWGNPTFRSVYKKYILVKKHR